MRNKLRERMGREEGFTLIELLVVMLILGILAAIAIPSFFAQRDKARDADAKAAAKTAQVAIETYATDNTNGEYSVGAGFESADLGALATRMAEIEPTLNDATFAVNATTDRGYDLTVTSDTGNTFSIERFDGSGTEAEGTTDLTCATAGEGGCPSGGDWSGS